MPLRDVVAQGQALHDAPFRQALAGQLLPVFQQGSVAGTQQDGLAVGHIDRGHGIVPGQYLRGLRADVPGQVRQHLLPGLPCAHGQAQGQAAEVLHQLQGGGQADQPGDGLHGGGQQGNVQTAQGRQKRLRRAHGVEVGRYFFIIFWHTALLIEVDMGLFYFDSLDSLQKRIPVYVAISFMLSVCYNIVYFLSLGVDIKTVPLTVQDYVLSFQGWLFTYISLVIRDFLPEIEDKKSIKTCDTEIDSRIANIEKKIDSAKKFLCYEYIKELKTDIKNIEYDYLNICKNIERKNKIIILKFRCAIWIILAIIILGTIIFQYIFNYRYVFLMNLCAILSFIPHAILTLNVNFFKHFNIAYIIMTIFAFSFMIIMKTIFFIQDGELSNIYFNKYTSESVVLRSLENGVFVYNQNNTFSFIYNNGNHIDYKIDKYVLESIHQEKNACYIEILCKKED